jgi:peptide/nickel transport system permease protein
MPGNLKAGLLLLVLLVAAALAAPLLASGEERWLRAPVPHDPNRIDLEAVLLPPESGHWMGTDALGRDLAARVIHGARVSLAVGLLAACFALLIGVPLGAMAGYRGGWADSVIARCIETILCFPTLLLALALLATAPPWLREMPDTIRISLVLGITGWIPVTRYLRAEFMKLRGSDMVSAARAMGGGHLRIVSRHILPSAMAPVLVTAAFAVGAAIGLEAALSFLGLGVRPPVATWGGLLSEAMEQVDRAWWLALFPGSALFLAVLGCNLLGEGIRDLLDPRSERGRR